MARAPRQDDERRLSLTIRLHPKAKAWIDRHTGFGKEFMTQTHAIERAIVTLSREMGDPIDVDE